MLYYLFVDHNNNDNRNNKAFYFLLSNYNKHDTNDKTTTSETGMSKPMTTTKSRETSPSSSKPPKILQRQFLARLPYAGVTYARKSAKARAGECLTRGIYAQKFKINGRLRIWLPCYRPYYGLAMRNQK